jgi:hypothetical protein
MDELVPFIEAVQDARRRRDQLDPSAGSAT